ncbi:hypothetical protein CH92_09665 [Stutzerimonas stutzeri]|uniref:Uncharacterized protein n=2 Tax=Stutzerimonas stutzeri TaxID=316 RepID=W8R3Y3_STUST|nr:hypothetical protein CH92_09665 [Stutzerimonas stutzeri]
MVGWLVVMGSPFANAGEAKGQMSISISIQPGCEVSSRANAGLYQVEHRNCTGVAAYKVNAGQDQLRLGALMRTSVSQAQKTAPQIVTVYW